MAEIYPNGQNLGTVTSSFYKNANAIRIKGTKRYLDRNLTITPQNQPASPVKVRLYFSKAEYDALDADALSQVSAITDVKIHKNNDGCGSAISAATTMISPVYSEAHGGSAYMLQADISSFSSFYFAASSFSLPLNLIRFTGTYRNQMSNLAWETDNEINTDYFIIERSTGNSVYEPIGTVYSKGYTNQKANYTFQDKDAASLGYDKLYYRLKMTDKDGSYANSNIVQINIPVSLITGLSIFPNPADKQTVVMLSSPRDQRISWQLADITGRIVMSNKMAIKKGDNRITLDLDKLKPGSYFLKVTGPYVNALEKIQKL
jgi:hypothetical protein